MKTNDLKKIIKVARSRNLGGANECLMKVEGMMYPIESVEFIVVDRVEHIVFTSKSPAPELQPSMKVPIRKRLWMNIRMKISSIKWLITKAILSAFGPIRGDKG